MGFRNLAVLVGAAVAALAVGPDKVAGRGGREPAKDPDAVQRVSRRAGAVRARESGSGELVGRPSAVLQRAHKSDASSQRLLSARTKHGAVVDTNGGTVTVSSAANPGLTSPDAAAGMTAGQLCAQPSEHCQAGDTLAASTSDRSEIPDPDGCRPFFVVDDFVPATTGNIEHVCWRGGYVEFTDTGTLECDGDVTTEDFWIRYYADAGGVPGQLIAEWQQLAGSLAVDGRAVTGDLVAELVNEYEYTATHGPVPVEEGQCYWIEISNEVSEPACCRWLWEAALEGNAWSLQDVRNDDYGTEDAIPGDSAFCLDVALQDSGPCVPPPPPNDECAAAEQISGGGDNWLTVPFNNLTARTDGPSHTSCLDAQAYSDEVHADVWYCWTAPCTDVAVVRTCGLTEIDTRIAVYDGCDTCPPTDANLLDCNDDRCPVETSALQSMAVFNAVEGQSYLIRIGAFPGALRGEGSFAVTCGSGLPSQPNCPGGGHCCDEAGTGTEGCSDEICCKLVCLCDPWCCELPWDATCATDGYFFECGAQHLCPDVCQPCGSTLGGDCCTATPETPGCTDADCCQDVCAADSFCCEVEWDLGCATHGYQNNGNGARLLCPDLCGWLDCPTTSVAWLDPPHGTVDVRQPFPPTDTGQAQGIRSFLVEAPPEAANPACWELSETGSDGSSNRVVSASVEPDVGVRVVLERPITNGAVTTLTYRGDGSSASFTAHPANVNADGVADGADVTAFIDCCLSQQCSPTMLAEKIYRCDIDHSGKIGPSDLLRLIDLLTGSEAFAPGWSGSSLPSK